MSILSIVGDLENKSAKDILKPLKDQIEKTLGKSIDEFSFSIDLKNSEFITRADKRKQVDKSKMMCIMMKTLVKKKLGKDAPDFTMCDIYYTRNENVEIVLYLSNGEIQTSKL